MVAAPREINNSRSYIHTLCFQETKHEVLYFKVQSREQNSFPLERPQTPEGSEHSVIHQAKKEDWRKKKGKKLSMIMMTILSAERSLFRSHIASTGKDRKKKVLLSRGAIIMQSTATIYLPSSSEEKRDDGKEKQEKVWRKNTTGGTHPTD